MNLAAGWVGILLGFVAGAVLGLFFYKDDWLGGYASWRRRMLRLAHISFFGLGFINLAFAFTVQQLAADIPFAWSSRLFVLGAITMPLTCYLSAYRKPFRHLFPIPVSCLMIGVSLFLYEGFIH